MQKGGDPLYYGALWGIDDPQQQDMNYCWLLTT